MEQGTGGAGAALVLAQAVHLAGWSKMWEPRGELAGVPGLALRSGVHFIVTVLLSQD